MHQDIFSQSEWSKLSRNVKILCICIKFLMIGFQIKWSNLSIVIVFSCDSCSWAVGEAEKVCGGTAADLQQDLIRGCSLSNARQIFTFSFAFAILLTNASGFQKLVLLNITVLINVATSL